MSKNSNSYEEQMQTFLGQVLSELSQLEAQKQALEESIAILRSKADAYKIVLEDYRTRTGKLEIESDWIKLLEGQTNKQRLIIIAQQNGGKIRMTPAVNLLYNKGFIKSKTREVAYTMVQGLLSDMAEEGVFEKLKPGEYRLIENKEGSK